MTLILDVNQSIIVIYSVEHLTFTSYWSDKFEEARNVVHRASKVVTFNGEGHDLYSKPLSAEEGKRFNLLGEHVDMMSVCWQMRAPSGRREWYGKGIADIYLSLNLSPTNHQAALLNSRSDEYERKQWLDVLMTFQIWELWEHGRLQFPAAEVHSRA